MKISSYKIIVGKTEDQTQIKRDVVNSKIKPITHQGPEPREIKNEKQKRKTKTLRARLKSFNVMSRRENMESGRETILKKND